MPSPGGRPVSLDWAVMGILNGTPDSFYAASRASGSQASSLALEMIRDGAVILDVGGESTRPGSHYVDAQEEIQRILPLVLGIRAVSQVPISIDTRKYSVAKAAFDAGADWINDVSALQDDPRLGAFAAETGMPVVLMHKHGVPDSMQKDPLDQNPLGILRDFFQKRVEYALGCGIREDRILLDPGIGFGKTLAANLEILGNLDRLDLGLPLLIGVSRKSFIHMISPSDPEGRLGGSIAGALWAAKSGAAVVRVHDVKETVQALRIWTAMEKGTP